MTVHWHSIPAMKQEIVELQTLFGIEGTAEGRQELQADIGQLSRMIGVQRRREHVDELA